MHYNYNEIDNNKKKYMTCLWSDIHMAIYSWSIWFLSDFKGLHDGANHFLVLYTYILPDIINLVPRAFYSLYSTMWELCFKFSLANIGTTLRFATHIYWFFCELMHKNRKINVREQVFAKQKHERVSASCLQRSSFGWSNRSRSRISWERG